jgi:predicted alpha/beta-fold hydrolase
MPYIFDDYNPPLIFKNNHLNTISAALWRKQEKLTYQRKRFKLKDGDFVDLDYVHTGLFYYMALKGAPIEPISEEWQRNFLKIILMSLLLIFEDAVGSQILP